MSPAAARPTDPITLGSAAAPLSAPSRVVFGPHAVNLSPGRGLGPAHTAYYAARAAGGAGIIVTETASVHDSDHPYEYAPRAGDCGPGWAEIARACRAHGTVVLAGLGHRGAEGVSAYTRDVLWGASTVAEPARREQPMVIINPEILWASDEKQLGEEGCLSVPGIYDGVERSTSVKIKALNEKGESREIDAEGLLAICIQHEMDHLMGKVFVEYLSPLKRNRIKTKLVKQQKRDNQD